MLSHLRPELEVSKEEDVGVFPVDCLLNAYPTFKSVLVWEIELLDLYWYVRIARYICLLHACLVLNLNPPTVRVRMSLT